MILLGHSVRIGSTCTSLSAPIVCLAWYYMSNTLVNFVDFSNLLLHLALFGNACIFWSACHRPDEPGATNSVPANVGPENELQRPFQWHGATGLCKSLQSAMMCQECDHCDHHPWKDAQFEGQQSGSIMTYHELSWHRTRHRDMKRFSWAADICLTSALAGRMAKSFWSSKHPPSWEAMCKMYQNNFACVIYNYIYMNM